MYWACGQYCYAVPTKSGPVSFLFAYPQSIIRPGQQRQGADLRDRRPGRVRVDGAHPGQARIQRHEEVEALGLTDLADDDASRSHAQGLFDQGPEGDLTGLVQSQY